jgi:hypothetical protein
MGRRGRCLESYDTTAMSDFPTLDTPLPTLLLDADRAWEWPQPPLARTRNRVMMPLDGGVQPCVIETHSGVTVQGHLMHFDIEACTLRVAIGGSGDGLNLAFANFRRLILTAPWPLARRPANAPVEHLPASAQERGYRVELAGGGELIGPTMGYVQAAGGWFLFEPLEGGAALRRIFVPQAACAAMHFGKSAEEEAAERWIATPEQLFAALETQKTAPIKPLGEALVDLGFVSRGAIEQTLRVLAGDDNQPLGEALVAAGLLDRADLRTALAHKMGYPLVDLTRFPIDPLAARKLSQRSMQEHHAVPLLQDGERLIVAIDDLARVPHLQSLRGLAGLQLVPVLASRASIDRALAALPQLQGTDFWADNVSLRAKAAPTAPGGLHRR